MRKRVNIKLFTEWIGRYGAEAMIYKSEFKNCTILSENLIAIEFSKLEVSLNKPICIGQATLDLVKTAIYDFHYGYIRKFAKACSVAYSDTDSLNYFL